MTGGFKIVTDPEVIEGTDVVVTASPVDTVSITFPEESIVLTVNDVETPKYLSF